MGVKATEQEYIRYQSTIPSWTSSIFRVDSTRSRDSTSTRPWVRQPLESPRISGSQELCFIDKGINDQPLGDLSGGPDFHLFNSVSKTGICLQIAIWVGNRLSTTHRKVARIKWPLKMGHTHIVNKQRLGSFFKWSYEHHPEFQGSRSWGWFNLVPHSQMVNAQLTYPPHSLSLHMVKWIPS